MTNALSTRLRVPGVLGSLGAPYTSGDTTIDLGISLPPAAVPDGISTYLPIVVDPDVTENVVWITDGPVSSHVYPCIGGQEGTLDGSVASAAPWKHGPTAQDFLGIRRVIGPFNVKWNTANILTGVPLFTPKVGDVILDAFARVNVAWNDTSGGAMDFGSFLDAGDSFATAWENVYADQADTGTDLSQNPSQAPGPALSSILETYRARIAMVAINAVPFCVKIGTGAATTGDVDIYVEVATPTLSY